MTKKDYVKIADIIKKLKDPTERFKTASHFATMLAEDNNLFRKDQFMTACDAKHPLES